ncbi:MAG: TIGR03013 family PEP-CTERM/XrtA system glycosyltransferase [Gammaproteobacteria bacterium]|nr:TIGR03013 family PEP-CTERM/XrtA system glycosyltransferase [Gammaproteobacteria bacterium]
MIRLFKQHYRVPFLILGAAEALVFILTVYAASSLLRLNQEAGIRETTAIDPDHLLPLALTFCAVMTVSLFSMGLYSTNHLQLSAAGILIRESAGYVLGTAVLTLLFYLVPELNLNRAEFLLSLTISFSLITALRLVFIDIVDKNHLKRKILVYGSGKNASHIAEYIDSPALKSGVKVVAYIHTEGDHDTVDPRMIKTIRGRLAKFAKKRRINDIIVAVDDRRRNQHTEQLLDCRLLGINVIELPSFFERETKKVRLDLVTPGWMIYSDGYKYGTMRDSIKKGFDIGASLILLLLTWPIMILTTAAILLENGWGSPILYRQTRIGKAQHPFEVLKFRSMIENAEQGGKVRWARQNDDRITQVGAIIRKFRIDELPQIFNVLRGEMSFVGPRPERPEFVEQLSLEIPYYLKRHYVKPGITGWAQLKYPYGESTDDAREKLQYDLYYAKNYTLFFDLVILIQTVEVVLFGKGAR